MILIATDNLRGSVTLLDVTKFIREILKLKTPKEFVEKLVEILASIPDTTYDRDYCDLVFRRVIA
jgi:hypothetical protein